MLRFAFCLLVACSTTVLHARPAAAEPEACRRAINKAAIAYTLKAEKAVDRCKKRALTKGQGLAAPPDSFSSCAIDTTKNPNSSLAKAAAKMRDQIEKACGGRNRDCNSDQGGSDANDPLASINWDIGACMNFGAAGASCTNAIDHCGDVATCLECIIDHTVDRAVNGILYDPFNPASFFPDNKGEPGKQISQCQVEVASEGSTFFSKKLDIQRKCWDAKLKGKNGFDDAEPCPDTDPKLGNGKPPAVPGDNATVAKLLKAEHRKVRGICRQCGGGGDRDRDLLCDEVDAEVGGIQIALADVVQLPFACADVTVGPNAVHPGGRACGQYNPVDSLQKYVDCVDCQLEFKADCLSFAVLGDGTVGGAEGIAYPAACSGR